MEHVQVKNWKTTFSQQQYQMQEEHLAKTAEIISNWKTAFRKEETWVQRNLGIPSLFIRLDCAVNGSLEVFEIEERPGGMGFMNSIHPEFKRDLQSFKKDWPKINCVVSNKRHSYDDDLWLPVISLEEARRSPDPILVRAEPSETEFHVLENRSISSLKAKGDKSYGLNLGLWKEITAADEHILDWNNGFCLKEKQTSKTRGIYIWHPEKNMWQKQGIGGIMTKTKILKVLQSNESVYYQPFINPMRSLETGHPMILRIFFLYNMQTGEYEFTGGFWNSRPNFKVHGASDAIVGLVK